MNGRCGTPANGTDMPGDGAEPVGTGQRRVPHDRRAPVVPDEDRGFIGLERIGDTDQIAGDGFQRVGGDVVRLVRPAIAAHVDRAGGETGGGDRAELVTPRIPALGKAVDEDHERAGAFMAARSFRVPVSII